MNVQKQTNKNPKGAEVMKVKGKGWNEVDKKREGD